MNRGLVPSNGSLARSIVVQEGTLIDSKMTPGAEAMVTGLTGSGVVPVSTMEDLENMYAAFEPLLPKPKGLDNWNSDARFAETRLTYLSQRLKAVDEPLFDLGLTNDQLCELLHSRLSRDTRRRPRPCNDPLRRVKLYGIDVMEAANYSTYDGVTRKSHLPGAQGMFGVVRSGKLVLLAIKLSNGLVYNKYDTVDEWTLAKVALTSAEHTMLSADHFFQTHGLTEPIRVEMMRHLSNRHPVHALLNHHLYGLFGLFWGGMERLFGEGSGLDFVSGWGAAGYTSYFKKALVVADFSKGFETDMRDRGLNGLRSFKYRDDSRNVLQLVRRFVWRFLRKYYKTNKHVTDDTELQAWAAATANSGCTDPFPGPPEWLKLCGGNVKNFPSSLHTFKQLAATVTQIIYLVAIKHHADNSDILWESGAYPAMTFGFWAPLPTAKGSLGGYTLRQFYPSHPTFVATQILLLSGFRREVKGTDSLLLSYDNATLGENVRGLVNWFKRKARRIDRWINRREKSNQGLKYRIQKPSNLPYFVWI